MDWKKMKIPPVLPYSEHAWLFQLMEPMKALLQVREDLQEVGREISDGELADAKSISIVQVMKAKEVGQAARNKLIKLDSLKPKESLVIRKRYELDGKGDRTLAEITGNGSEV